METERKFLVGNVPGELSLKIVAINHIMQGYLTTGEEELRVRASNESFFLTFKRGTGIQREEHEFEISKETFTKLSKTVKFLSKKRYKVDIGNGLFAEIDHYWGLPGELSGLVTVEVEFSDLEEALAFNPPDWFGVEVTGDKTYSNSRLVELVQGQEGLS